MRINPFESQLERLARTLTEQFGVKVICQGDNAWTNGSQVVLPSLPESINNNLERMMVGFLDHELAHVAFSDFKVAEDFSKKHPGFEGMLNVVEDALIERRAMQRWPGVRANLDAMFAQVRDRIVQLIAQRNPFERFCTAIYLKLAHYNDMLGLDQEVAGYMDLLDQFPAVQDTHQAATLAEQLLQRWLQTHKHRHQRRRQPKESDHDSSSSSGHSTSDSAEHGTSEKPQAENPSDNTGPEHDKSGDGNAESDVDQAADTPGSASTGNTGSQCGSPAEGTRGENDLSANDHAPTPASIAGHGAGGFSVVSQAVKEAITEAVTRMDNSSEYRVYTKRHDRIAKVEAASDQAVHSMLATGGDVVRRLRRGLANALRSAEKRWWRDDQLRGSLSPRTLYRVCTDRTQLDIFRIRSVVQGKSTAVSVLLDASGSMTTRKMDVARQAMRVLLEALADLKIATEALTFTTGDRFSLSEASRACGCECATLQRRFSRFGNLEIGVVKQFAEPVKRAISRLPTVRGSGLTPLGEAMQITANRLITRPENRRILVVLTDGKAGCESGDAAASLHAQHIAGRIAKNGIELVGVGIQDDSLRAIVADTVVIHQLPDLPAQLCKLLGRTLRKGVLKVG